VLNTRPNSLEAPKLDQATNLPNLPDMSTLPTMAALPTMATPKQTTFDQNLISPKFEQATLPTMSTLPDMSTLSTMPTLSTSKAIFDQSWQNPISTFDQAWQNPLSTFDETLAASTASLISNPDPEALTQSQALEPVYKELVSLKITSVVQVN
jgi:hypothetical protein